ERSGRGGELAGERLSVVTALELVGVPRERVGAALVEDGDANHAHVPGVAGLLAGVRVADRAEAEGRHGVHALAEPVDLELAAGVDEVAALAEARRLAVEHVEPV